ncbi:MAG: hypothetical protein GXP61_02780 [Epsilonproteobacteria bacterium]|nr:hypothetical protein [Campylobacterota bacterium]
MIEKNIELDKVIAGLEKRFGEGVIIKMGKSSKINIKTISSGSLILDKALGGGIPIGRMIEILGNNSSGKTTMALTILAQFQKAKYKTAFVDLEHCIAKGSYIYDAKKQNYIKIEKLENKEFSTLCFDKKGNTYLRRATCEFTGNEFVYEIRTQYGNNIKLTGEHKVLTDNGKIKKVKTLKIGNSLFTPISIKSKPYSLKLSKKDQSRQKHIHNYIKCKITNIQKSKTKIKVYDISTQEQDYYKQFILCNNLIVHNSINVEYAKNIGVNVKEMLLTQPDNLEAAFEIIEALIVGGGIKLIVIDSVAALVPKAELEGDYGQVHMGLQARLMGQALRKLTGLVSKTGTTLVFINQTRAVLDSFGYGPKKTTPGGNALKFYTTVRMETTNMGKLEGSTSDGKLRIGNKTRVKIIKNKMAAPFKEAHFDIMYNKGISTSGEVLDLAIQYRIISKKGAFYDLYGVAIQGRENAKIYLEENKEILKKLQQEVKNYK